jgi:hypothetical protein
LSASKPRALARGAAGPGPKAAGSAAGLGAASVRNQDDGRLPTEGAEGRPVGCAGVSRKSTSGSCQEPDRRHRAFWGIASTAPGRGPSGSRPPATGGRRPGARATTPGVAPPQGRFS